MRKLLIAGLLFLSACAPPTTSITSNSENTPVPSIVTENVGDGISIYHDDIHNNTCYIVTSLVYANYFSYQVTNVSEVKSIFCVSDN